MKSLASQKAAAEAAEDPDMITGIRHLIGRKGVEYEEGVWQMQKKMDFCLGSEMVDKLLASKLAGGGGSYAADGEEFDREAAVNLCTIMIQADFVKRVTVTDHNGRNNLNISHDQTFEDSKEAYYLITYEGPKTIKYVVGTAIVVGFLIVCLFPVWPMQAKIWVRDGSRYVLMALMGMLVPITIGRPIVAGLTGWWYLPNLWESEEFFASFKPTWQPPSRDRDAMGSALWTIGITAATFAILYVMLVTEVPVEGEEPDAVDNNQEMKDDLFDSLLETEDVFVEPPEVEEPVADLTGTDDTEPTDSKAAFKDPSWGDDGDEDDEDMAEFLREKEDEERKIERKRAKNK